MMRSLWLAAIVVAALALGTARAEETVSLAGLKVTVWEPAGSSSGEKRPVIIFSHGFHGCGTQSSFLMTALAADGYVVFAPNHADATCHGGAARWRDPAEVSFGRPDRWTPSTYHRRFDDIRHLVAALKQDPRWAPGLDLARIGLVGHSLGGYTVLALAGAWPGQKLDGVKAVLALSPYAQAFLAHDTLGGLGVPVMYQGGSRDLGITPAVKRPGGAYDRSPAPKYFVEFTGAGHLAWTDLRRDLQPAITASSIAFLDHYVKSASANPLLTHAGDGVATLRYASELGTSGAR
ncbi:MAG TPA: alpha/beta fold hydrolase [Stellaceae bacterium]|nr:alpha/beta fold hydrolase [Stellaceae bacterium]